MDQGARKISLALDALVAFERALTPHVVWLRSSSAAGRAAELVAALAELSDEDLVRLDGRVRPWWWEHGPRERRLLGAALAARNPVVVRAATAAGTLSPDGYLREAAVNRLGNELPWSFALLAVRTTDWVAQVRRAAMAALEAAETDSAIEHLPLLEQLSASRARAGEIREWVERRLAGDQALDALSAARGHTDARVRRAAWRRLNGHRPEQVAREIGRALSDPDLAIRLWAVQRLDRLEDPQLLALGPQLLADPVGRIRAVGLSIALSTGGSDGDLTAKRSLPDRSAAVRRVAQAYLTERSVDVSEFYKELLGERVTGAIVLGLAESGGRAALPQLRKLLTDERSSVRRAALRAITKVSPEQAPELASACVADESEPVARDALRVLASKATSAEVVSHVEAASTNDSRPRVRATALSALRRHRWRWLALALAQLADSDAGVRAHAQEELRLWLGESAHVYYGPTEIERRLIERSFDNADPDQRRVIEFVIRTARQR